MAASKASFVQVLLQEPQRSEILGLLVQAHFEMPKYPLHCTVMYDERELDQPLCTVNPNKVYEATIQNVEVLGDGLVFHLISPSLVEEHLRLKDRGYQSSFGAYLPHMSMAYKFDKYEVLKADFLFASWAGRTLTFSEQQFGD